MSLFVIKCKMIKYKGVFMKIKRILIIISSLITLYSCGTIHVNADIVLVNKQNTIKSIKNVPFIISKKIKSWLPWDFKILYDISLKENG